MRRLVLMMMILFCGVTFVAGAQDKTIEKISEMDDVDATYITKSMLRNMATGNISINGMNISRIAKDLTGLQVLYVEKKSVAKARNLLKPLKNTGDMEVILKIKDDGERTELFGKKNRSGNYSQLLFTVDEGDAMTIVYITGNVSQESFSELSKKANNVASGNNSNVKASFVIQGNYNTSIILDSDDEQLAKIEKKIAEIDKKINRLEKEKLAPIEKQISEIDAKINKAKSTAERNRLYTKRNELYAKRGEVYAERGELYGERGSLYAENGGIYAKKYGSDIKYSNIIIKNNNKKKTFSVANANVDKEWLEAVEKLGISNGYVLKNWEVRDVNKELASVSYRIKELKDKIKSSEKFLKEIEGSKGKQSDEYMSIAFAIKEYKKRLAMFEDLYNLIAQHAALICVQIAFSNLG